MGEKGRVKMSEVIIFKVPKGVKEELEQFCKINGYNISDAVRMAIEKQILDPSLKPQAELWQDFIEWRKRVDLAQEKVLEALRALQTIVERHEGRMVTEDQLERVLIRTFKEAGLIRES